MEQLKFKKQLWVNISDPNEANLQLLQKKYKFHELDLEDCIKGTERPKVDEYDKYLFMVLQFPNYNESHHRFDTGQLSIFIGQNYLITIHKGKLKPVDGIFEECKHSLKARRAFFGESTGYLLYEIISSLFEMIFPMTDKIQHNMKRIEDEIFESKHPKDQLFDIMVLKKNIITLRKIILPQRAVIATLEHKQKQFLPEHLEVYFDDVVDQIERLWSILETQKEIIASLEGTNESILSHKINLTIRTLTVFSAIMLPLTFLSGLFGMNVKLPFVGAMEKGGHFWFVSSLMILVVVGMFGIFKWKKWL